MKNLKFDYEFFFKYSTEYTKPPEAKFLDFYLRTLRDN
jgi:hypothetical protein